MKSWRFFVTSVAFVSIAAGCARFKAASARSQALVQGNAKLEQAAALEKNLSPHQIDLFEAKEINWRAMGKADRDELKQILLRYVALINEALAVDARRGYYITHRDKVIRKRDGAAAIEKAIENFEEKNGENFDPKSAVNSTRQARLAD